MKELAVIFPYYRDEPVVRFHYERLVVNNPEVDVFPTSSHNLDCLPNTLKTLPEFQPHDGDWWHFSDLLAYSAYKQTKGGYKRYSFIEWDCRVEIELRQFYREGWDCDLVGTNIFTIGANPDWDRFDALRETDRQYWPHVAAVSPQNGYMASSKLYEAITSLPKLPLMFCEVRLATLANFFGLKTLELTDPPCVNYDGNRQVVPTLEVPFKGIFHKIEVLPGESIIRRSSK